jgi:hypothetical protein
MSSYKIIIELPASQRHLDGWEYWLKELLHSPNCVAVLLPITEHTNFSPEFVPSEKITEPSSLKTIDADWKLSFRKPDEQSQEFSKYNAGLIGYLAFDCNEDAFERKFKSLKSESALILTDFLPAEIDPPNLFGFSDYLKTHGLYVPFQFSFEEKKTTNTKAEKASSVTIFYDSSFSANNKNNEFLSSRTENFYEILGKTDRISSVNLNKVSSDRLPYIMRNSDHLIIHDLKPKDFDAVLTASLTQNKKLTINCRKFSFILRLLQKGLEPHNIVSNKKLLAKSVRSEALDIISKQETGSTPSFVPKLFKLFGTNFSLTDFENFIFRKPSLGTLFLQTSKHNLKAIFKLILNVDSEDKDILNKAAKSFLHDYLKTTQAEELYEFSEHKRIKDLILDAFGEFEYSNILSFTMSKSLLDNFIDFLGYNMEYDRLEQFVKRLENSGLRPQAPFFKFTHSLFSNHGLYTKFRNIEYASQNRETLEKAIHYWRLSLTPKWSDLFSEHTCKVLLAFHLALTQKGDHAVEFLDKLDGHMNAHFRSVTCLMLLLGGNREMAQKNFAEISLNDITLKGLRPTPHVIFLHVCTAMLLNEEKALIELLPILQQHQDFFAQNQEYEFFHYPLLISLVLKGIGMSDLSLKYLDLSVHNEHHVHYAQDWWDRIDNTKSSINLTKIEPLLSLVSL